MSVKGGTLFLNYFTFQSSGIVKLHFLFETSLFKFKCFCQFSLGFGTSCYVESSLNIGLKLSFKTFLNHIYLLIFLVIPKLMMIWRRVNFGSHSQFVISFHPGNGRSSLWTFLPISKIFSDSDLYFYSRSCCSQLQNMFERGTQINSPFHFLRIVVLCLLFSVTIMSCIVA